MSSDERILSDQEVILDVMSKDFFNLEMPVTDFNLFLHCDVNDIFTGLQLRIPLTDGAPPDSSAGDQDQPTAGTFTNTDWRNAYKTHVQTNQAYRSASYSTDRSNANILCNLVREILSELFLGNKSDTSNGLQTGTYGTSRLRFKTAHLCDWLNASDDSKVGQQLYWGVDCFQASHFDSIHRALVAKNKYTAALAPDGVTRTHGTINLAAGDSIGVRVTLKENASNLLHVNFYLQQTAGYEAVPALLVPAFTSSAAVDSLGASYSVSASSEAAGSEAYKACDDSASSWTSASGMFNAFTGEHKASGDAAKIKHGREGEYVRVAVDEVRALTEVKWDFGAVTSAAGTPKDFRILISFDGTDYFVLHDVTGYALAGPQNLDLTGKEYFAKEVVLHITKIHKNDVITACSVVEFMSTTI
jgi:hypothetical protein